MTHPLIYVPRCADCLDTGIDVEALGEQPCHCRESATPAALRTCAHDAQCLPYRHNEKRRRGSNRPAHGKGRMNDTSQGAISPAAAPPRKMNFRPVGRPKRSPDVLAAAGALIRARREALGMSMRRLAERVDRSHGYIGDVERGDCTICFDLAGRFATALDLDLAVILCAFRVVPEHAAAAFFDVDRMRAALAGGGQ